MSVGSRSGIYNRRTVEDIAMLSVEHDDRVLEVVAAPDTPLTHLQDVAIRIVVGVPMDEQDLGRDWQVVYSTDTETGSGRTVLLHDGLDRGVHVAVAEGVSSDALTAYRVPYLGEPVRIRGNDGHMVRATDGTIGVAWFERPGVAVTMSVTGDEIDGESVAALAGRLVVVDADGWDEFVATIDRS